MTTLAPARAAAQPATATAPASLLQRACACGKSAGPSGSCGTCDSEARFGASPLGGEGLLQREPSEKKLPPPLLDPIYPLEPLVEDTTTDDEYAEGGGKVVEALLETEPGKAVTDKVTSVLFSSPLSAATTLSIAGGGIAGLALTGKELPFQLPAVPLSLFKPEWEGASVGIIWNGPVASPTEAALVFTYKPPSSPKQKRNYAEETARMAADQQRFRDSLNFQQGPGGPVPATGPVFQPPQPGPDSVPEIPGGLKLSPSGLFDEGLPPGLIYNPLAPMLLGEGLKFELPPDLLPKGEERPVQKKLSIGSSSDPLEAEADRVADQVLARPAATGTAPPQIQRLSKQGSGGSGNVPESVHRTLGSSGAALDANVRQDMEARFGQDFGSVRIHTDAPAARSARDVDAHAYTVGSSIVFGAGQYAPGSGEGRRLLAHELTHVVQQGGSDQLTDGSADRASQDITRGGRLTLARADRDAVGYVMRLGEAARTGLQFWPTDVVDTVVGPTSVEGGLLSSGASQLIVILGQDATLRRFGAQLLPLWTTATPFTPPGAAAPNPLDIITADELARGLLVFNRYYLPVPAMTKWNAGLRFPLPVEIDSSTGIATLHPLRIRALATAFDPAWEPLLDQAARGTAAPAAATLTADATAFLARQTDAMSRGMHLGARAVTNAIEAQPFIDEVFRQLGPGAFDVALEMMDSLVNREAALLASQVAGADILDAVRSALALAPPAPTKPQQDSVARSNVMLGLVAGAAARVAPAAARTRPQKTITIDTVKLDGSNRDPALDVRQADSILSQCNIRVTQGINATATAAQTTGWLGGDNDIRTSGNCSAAGAEERSLFQGVATTFGFGNGLRAYYVQSLSGINGRAYSCDTGSDQRMRNMMVVENSADSATMSHELGHIIARIATHTATGLLGAIPAAPAARSPELIDDQCKKFHDNA